MATETLQEPVEYTLEADSEFRFEVGKDKEGVSFKLLSGSAEVFGAELVKDRSYQLMPRLKAAIFTRQGCVLHLYGRPDVWYKGSNTTMVMYENIHRALGQMRTNAQKSYNRGPRVLIAGPIEVGKSTLCKILSNYAVRSGWKPLLVDLDVAQNDIATPGTIGAMVIDRPTDFEDGFYSIENPLLFHYGHTNPLHNPVLYNSLLSSLAEEVNTRSEVDKYVNFSGAIINMSAWVREHGYKCLLHAASVFEIEVLVILDQEFLVDRLRRDVPDFVKVVPLPKSGGVVEKTQELRNEERDLRVGSYLYGVNNTLHPQAIEVRLCDVQVFKIGGPTLPESMLPKGRKATNNHTTLVPIAISQQHVNHVLSLSQASSVEEDIVHTNIAALVVILKVDEEKGKMMLLSAVPRPFVWNILLFMNNIRYVER